MIAIVYLEFRINSNINKNCKVDNKQKYFYYRISRVLIIDR